MPFPFTFKLVIPGIPNPFATFTKPEPVDRSRPRPLAIEWHPHRTRFSPEKSPSPAAPLSRKRRWQPSLAEISQSTATIASTAGYINTSKADMPLSSLESSEHEYNVVDSELPPPPKRRRTLAGSIVSTAINACLIGTAVGLTVYRLWRDRDKQPESQTASPPPPPYEQEWTPISHQPEAVCVTPSPSRSRKSRHTTHSLRSTKSIVHQRRTRVRPQVYSPPHTCPLSPPECDHDRSGHEEELPVVADQMDWIGDKLSALIKEGKRALGTEVVVMSDAKEDEIDDGTGQWEEENSTPVAISPSRTSSIRHSKAPHALPIPYAYSPSPSFSDPRYSPPFGTSPSARSLRSYDPSTPPPPRTPQPIQDIPVGPHSGTSPSSWEDESAWTTPELRESMEKARARLLRLRDRGM